MAGNLAAAAAAAALVLAVMLGVAPALLQAAETKTSKERLWDKGSDEQRLDNCGVPPERRGDKPRPGCPAVETATAPEPDGAAPVPADPPE